jgi:hypothetical protein
MSYVTVLSQRAAVCQLDPNEDIPPWLQDDKISAMVRTPDEFSVVCDESNVPDYVKAEKGWRILKVQGPLEFSQVGVLAALIVPLAQAGVSIFAISTYNTDYILVKEKFLAPAIDSLRNAGHIVEVA